MSTVKQLYQQITGDLLIHQRTIAAQLAREAKARRRLVSLYAEGLSDRWDADRVYLEVLLELPGPVSRWTGRNKWLLCSHLRPARSSPLAQTLIFVFGKGARGRSPA